MTYNIPSSLNKIIGDNLSLKFAQNESGNKLLQHNNEQHKIFILIFFYKRFPSSDAVSVEISGSRCAVDEPVVAHIFQFAEVHTPKLKSKPSADFLNFNKSTYILITLTVFYKLVLKCISWLKTEVGHFEIQQLNWIHMSI